jgi:ATP-binding cassette subfamily B protein
MTLISSFSHAGGQRVFDHLDLTVAPGEKVGIVGETGAGKSTLVQLLLKAVQPESGQILVGGRDIAEIDADAIRRLIGVVPQDVGLFHRSLSENLAYGRPGAGSAEIEAAARSAHIHGAVDRMAAGYSTVVGERGLKLSGGQRQRVAIARALLRDAPILVLDEATSSLDSRTERLIQAGLTELLRGRTVLAIAHRLSTLQDMDRIVVLERGRVVESGSYAELLARSGGRYAAFWNA